jgi:hypothetical protein
MSRYVPPHQRGHSLAPSASSSLAPSASCASTRGPMTMASATRSSGSVSSRVAPSQNDFPTLGAASSTTKTGVWMKDAGKRFSDMARSWGVQQKEEEEQQKRLAKEKQNEAQRQREQERKERAFYGVGVVNTVRLLNGGSGAREERRYDLGGEQEALEEEVLEEEDPDEEETYEQDDGWNERRSKNELY